MLVRGLRIATAALLTVDGYVHFNDAGLYDIGTGAAITQGSLFRAQASIAVVTAIASLIRPHWIVSTIAVVVAASAATAVYRYTSVDVGPRGPLPDMQRPNPGAARQARVRPGRDRGERTVRRRVGRRAVSPQNTGGQRR